MCPRGMSFPLVPGRAHATLGDIIYKVLMYLQYYSRYSLHVYVTQQAYYQWKDNSHLNNYVVIFKLL